MDTNDPFSTFQKSAFRLEALPQYLVEDETEAFEVFKAYRTLPKTFGTEWADLVNRNVDSGKKMDRLRLVSDELSSYEQFELQVYSGIQYGEDIRIGARSSYTEHYLYDFWFFDDDYIAQMHYESDGTFVSINVRKANDREKEHAQMWQDIFNRSSKLE